MPSIMLLLGLLLIYLIISGRLIFYISTVARVMPQTKKMDKKD